MIDIEDIRFNLICEDKEHYKLFVSHYEFENMVYDRKKDNPQLIPKNKRTCRFCNKSYPAVFFKTDSHLISKLLGNNSLLSDTECDGCNSKFSKYETHLSNFIGGARTISLLKTNGKTPKFKSADKSIELFEEDNILKLISEKDGNFQIDEENKRLTLNLLSSSYIPINVFKSILKIGFSILPIEECTNYSFIKEVLYSNINDKDLNIKSLFTLVKTFVPGFVHESPIVFSYKLKNNNELLPSRTFIIYFQNYVYQFYMVSDSDLIKLNNKHITLYTKPVFINRQYIKEKYGEINQQIVNLSSSTMEKTPKHTLSFKYKSISFNSVNSF